MMTKQPGAVRALLPGAKRVVVKLGTRLLATETGRPEYRRINSLVRDIAALSHAGKEVVLVTSGAVGMGLEALGKKTRPKALPDLQMAAAIGQARLMAYYDKLFQREKLKVGQVLLTHDDLNNRIRHLNARNTMLNLLRHKIVPIVNENDVVAVDELNLKIGDNDTLAALVALLIDADVLVLLTSADGLYKKSDGGRKKRVPYLERVTREALALAKGKGSALSVGGMSTKLRAADTVANVGALTVIADGRKPKILEHIFEAEDTGTLIGGMPGAASLTSSRKQWLVFFTRAKGAVVVDDGAKDALQNKGRSLLPIGVKQVKGLFAAGSVINVQTASGKVIARGLTAYSSEHLEKIRGKKTSDIVQILGAKDYDEVIHRDNLVLMAAREEETV